MDNRNFTRRPAGRFAWAFFGALVCLPGCTHFHEVHYFRQAVTPAGKRGVAPDYNYFRLTVSGSTGLTSSRFTSGYFDEEAVNQYFSEFSSKPKPADAAAPEAVGVVKGGDAAAATADNPPPIKPIAGAASGRTLVMMLSTTSDAITNGIDALANNQALLDSVARIANRGESDKLATLQAQANEEALRQTTIRTSVGERLKQLKGATANQPQLLLDITNTVARSLGSRAMFTSVADAEKWIREHREELTP